MNEKILIIEDNKEILSSIKNFLTWCEMLIPAIDTALKDKIHDSV